MPYHCKLQCHAITVRYETSDARARNTEEASPGAEGASVRARLKNESKCVRVDRSVQSSDDFRRSPRIRWRHMHTPPQNIVCRVSDIFATPKLKILSPLRSLRVGPRSTQLLKGSNVSPIDRVNAPRQGRKVQTPPPLLCASFKMAVEVGRTSRLAAARTQRQPDTST